MDEAPRKRWWAVVIPLLLLGVWIDYALSIAVAVLAPGLSPRELGISQLTIAAGIATIDLWVIYYVVGLGRHSEAIGAWMDRAFSGEGLKVMTKCPRCGYEERPPGPSKAEELLRKRGA